MPRVILCDKAASKFKSASCFSITLFKFSAFAPMKRLVVIVYVGFLLAPFLHAQDSTPAPPPVEPQVPGQQPGPSRWSPPGQAVVPVPVRVAPPNRAGPVL